MNNTEIKEALSQFGALMMAREDAYMENGGEVTEETEAIEETMGILKELLTGEGIDSLGRWLAVKQDEIKRLKAEKDSVTRQINAANGTVDYIKYMVNKVLTMTETDKAKGTCYSFTPTMSVKTDVDKELLKLNYQGKVNEAIRSAGIPDYIGFSLTASATAAELSGVAEGDEGLFSKSSTPSCRFTKPKESKKTDEEEN